MACTTSYRAGLCSHRLTGLALRVNSQLLRTRVASRQGTTNPSPEIPYPMTTSSIAAVKSETTAAYDG